MEELTYLADSYNINQLKQKRQSTPTLSQQSYQHIQDYIEIGKTKIIGIGRKVKDKRKNGRSFPLELAVTEMRVNGQRKLVGIIRDLGVIREKTANLTLTDKKVAV